VPNADTIEDEPGLSADETLVLLRRFVAVLNGREDGAPLARELAPRLDGPPCLPSAIWR